MTLKLPGVNSISYVHRHILHNCQACFLGGVVEWEIQVLPNVPRPPPQDTLTGLMHTFFILVVPSVGLPCYWKRTFGPHFF